MPVRVENREVDGGLNRLLDDNEHKEHTHYLGDSVCIVTLYRKASEDPKYTGEPYECEFCGYEADYSYVCEECGEKFRTSQSLAGHMSAHKTEESDEEEQ